MNRITVLGLALAMAMTSLVACDTDGDDGVSIEATGTIFGLAWVDRNGNTELDGNDGPAPDVRVTLVPAAGGEAAFTAVSETDGEFVFPDVMVGDYRVVVDNTTVGDTLQVLRIDSADVTVEANDTSVLTVGFSFPAVPIDSARREPAETRLFVNGLVLTRWGTFGEASLHVRDTTGAIQAVRVQSTQVIPGDSVRVLGVTSVQTGQPVIKDGVVFLLRTGVESPPPVPTATATAATAADGLLDADLILLDDAVVKESRQNATGETVLTVNDGSGPVDVLFDGSTQFFLQFPDGVVGSVVDVAGVLVPAAAGGPWVVKPRGSSDVVVGG